MKVLDNKKVKKLIILNIIIVLLAFIVLIILNKVQARKSIEKVNNTISLLIDCIKEEYPNVNDEELINILNNENIKRENIIRKYGIGEKDITIKELKNDETKLLLYNSIILITTGLLLTLILFVYLKDRKREIDNLIEYIEKILNKSYDLSIEDNSEDELSSLKNELYKITVTLKEEAKNSTKTKELLSRSVSDISHQLKTPLTSVLILLDNLSQSEEMDKATKERFIREITRQIEGMNWLVISLLKLSKLDAGVVNFNNTSIDVNKLVNEVVSNLEIMAELKRVSFNVKNMRKEGNHFIGDYNWNKEAIKNIVKNAIEHTNEDTAIEIEIEENDVYTSIKIKDKGEGINKEDLKHIFDRFYKTQNIKENSFGIGLSLAKSIIERQKGYIEVESKKGEGTVFTIKYIK